MPEEVDTTWLGINKALLNGNRGLRGGCSLARLLKKRRGVRNHLDLPRLTVKQILAWADEHHARTGSWPTLESGKISGTNGETWNRVDYALRHGLRGMRGGSLLAKLIASRHGLNYRTGLRPLTKKDIVKWARLHRRRTEKWPTQYAGPIEDALGVTWKRVDRALRYGRRGIKGGSSLARLCRGLR